MFSHWPWTSLVICVGVAVAYRAIVLLCGSRSVQTAQPLPKKRGTFEADPSALPHATLAAFWAYGGDYPVPYPDAEKVVRDLERRHGIVLPDDFRAYLLTTAPKDDQWDGTDMIWWSLSRVRSIPEEYEHSLKNPLIAAKAERYLFFADYCLWFWAWAICCEAGEDYGKVAIIGAGDRWVADSFTDFVKAYVGNPDSVN
ncbi:hypothetical protein HNP52_001016 [Sphingomonas kyeonggiensis]|uniref:Knr4/Smi1-like domain-containing protein n=1 Tax=Sphingomonas kyeonggiensis TaxID=1268553 RepID=A0A7W7NQC2_9SPHN|nr:SMI1/KNR4 family protein [Sphingomonas kyeonggiensis]MBB4837965.1 hypothetical protein [Sphingomonas kyeonggiensis]